MKIGLFVPIGNNGWIISTTSPQYKPSFGFEKEVVQKAEQYGFDFALSMIKFHGFGGPSEFWDYNLESFTLMAGLAAVTERIELFASTAVLTLPPAVVARMAVTIDSISGGRFGINIVSGWQGAEYEQMGLWPGDEYYGYRYAYSGEYVQVMKELWETGQSSFQGEHFHMDGCMLKPGPSRPIPLVAAGQSPAGMEFAAQHADFNFALGTGMNTPTAHALSNERMIAASARAGRVVKTYALFMVIAAETDEVAMARWQSYCDGVDVEAIAWMTGQALADNTADESSTARSITVADGAVNMNIGTIIGSYATVARLLDQAGEVAGMGGVMLIFDDFLRGLDDFGRFVQPLMTSRADLLDPA
jgi:pyrimidine oxygenase